MCECWSTPGSGCGRGLLVFAFAFVLAFAFSFEFLFLFLFLFVLQVGMCVSAGGLQGHGVAVPPRAGKEVALTTPPVNGCLLRFSHF